MIKVKQYKGVTVGVLGLGRTGIAAACSLLAGQANVVAWDDNTFIYDKIRQVISNDKNFKSCEKLFIEAIENGNLRINPDPNAVRTLSTLVVSPGIAVAPPKLHPIVKIALDSGVRLSSDFDILAVAQPSARYIGITGTNGKSTTTALIGHILQSSGDKVEVGGNTGTAVLTLNALEHDGTYVLEASSFQLERCDIRFNLSILLNITADHLDRYGNMDSYIEAKSKIFANHKVGDSAIISIDCPYSKKIYQELRNKSEARVIPISVKQRLEYGASLLNEELVVRLDEFNLSRQLEQPLALQGPHNAENMLAAYVTCLLEGLEHEIITRATNNFAGLRHRMEQVAVYGNLKFINDSKATNVDAAGKALNTFSDIYWIAGGISKDEGISSLQPYFDKIVHVFLIGKSADDFAPILKANGVKYTISGTLLNAMESIENLHLEHGNILLSPACASFDQWRDFEERGETFSALAKEIIKRRYYQVF
jgi:UDP-N-acetylmuramoylalanine--D-glutamate ligase